MLDASRPYQVQDDLLAIWLRRGRGQHDRALGLLCTLDVCSNPTCLCTEVGMSGDLIDDRLFSAEMIERTLTTKWREQPPTKTPSAKLTLDFLTGVVEAHGGGELPAVVRPFFVEPLPGWVLDHVFDLWAPSRPFGISWREQALDHWSPGDLLPHMVAFPDARFDRYRIEGRTYQVDLCFNVDPAHPSMDAVMEVFEVRDSELASIGGAQLDAKTLVPRGFQGATKDRSMFIKVFMAWKDRHTPIDEALRSLGEATRKRGAELLRRSATHNRRAPVAVATPDVKPTRNAPCPCGSGKKYKRCCGA